MASVSKRTWTHNGAQNSAWVVRYVDERGVRRSKQFEQKKAADACKRKVERELEDGLHTPDRESLTVARVAEQFLKYTEQRERDRRIGRARSKRLHATVNNDLLPALGGVKINRLEMGQVEKLFDQLVRGRGLKSTTARERIMDFKLLQDYALKRGWMKRRPVDEALAELRGIARTRIRIPTAEEVAAILKAASVRQPGCTARSQARIECMLHIAAFCGLRQGEQLGLRLDHVRFEAGVIAVRHSLLREDELKGPKTAAGVRDVRVPGYLMAMLKAYSERFYVAGDRNPQGLLFRTRKGCAFDAATLHRQWHDLVERAGISEAAAPLRWHSLRHFYVSWLIRHGVPVTDAAKMAGHSTFDITLQVYAHATMTEAVQHEAIERMAASFAPTAARAPQQLLSL